MVGQVVAGSVAPVIISSATEDGGLLNRLLKLLTIGAIIAGFVIIAVVIFIAFEIFQVIGGVVGDAVSIFDFFTAPFTSNPFIAGAGSALTGLASAFFIRR